jgi:hypothetical protein
VEEKGRRRRRLLFTGERHKQSWRRRAKRDIVLAISLLVKKIVALVQGITRAFACVTFGGVVTVLAPT